MDGDTAFAGACFAVATWVRLAASVTMDLITAQVSTEYVRLFATVAATLCSASFRSSACDAGTGEFAACSRARTSSAAGRSTAPSAA